MGSSVLPSDVTQRNLPSDVTQRKGVYKKLLLLGSVVGALSFLTPAYAVEVWDFSIPTDVNLGTSNTYTGSAGTPVLVTSIGLPAPGDLIAKNLGPDEVGLGLTNDPSGENEVTPGQFLQINISNIPNALRGDLSFQTSSTTGIDAWKLTAGNFQDIVGGFPIASCAAFTSATSCDDMITINATGFDVLSFTATSGNVLLRELDAVPLPGALWLFGTGLAGLGFVSRRRSKVVSVL